MFDANASVRGVGFGGGGSSPTADASPVTAPATSTAASAAGPSLVRVSNRALERAQRLGKLPERD